MLDLVVGPKDTGHTPALRGQQTMQDAVAILGGVMRRNEVYSGGRLVLPRHGLARIQWGGPWTAPGVNKKWAYRFTHWIGSFFPDRGGENRIIFDINAGLQYFDDWDRVTVPKLIAEIPRANGEWFITHSWEVSTRG